jgi:glycosyltransferase involved in cell wall biosynthesis
MLEIPHRRFTPGAFIRLVRFIRARKIDIVHGHGRAAGILARPAALLAGVRCFYTPHGGTPVNGARALFKAAVEYLLSAITDGVIAVSGTEAQGLKSLCAFRNRLEVIRNGVQIPPVPSAPDIRLAGPLRIVHVTRFVFQKNSHLLLDVIAALRAMGQLDRFEFVILGDGPGRAEFEADATGRGLDHSVKLLGAVREPGDCLESAFCLVSTSRWEGLPLALLEAMARGVPAIATDVAGNKDAVADQETGFLYDPASPRTAAGRLVQLANDPALWKQMVRATRQRAREQFSVRAMADATFRLYSRPAQKPAPVRRPGAAIRNIHSSPPALIQGHPGGEAHSSC